MSTPERPWESLLDPTATAFAGGSFHAASVPALR